MSLPGMIAACTVKALTSAPCETQYDPKNREQEEAQNPKTPGKPPLFPLDLIAAAFWTAVDTGHKGENLCRLGDGSGHRLRHGSMHRSIPGGLWRQPAAAVDANAGFRILGYFRVTILTAHDGFLLFIPLYRRQK